MENEIQDAVIITATQKEKRWYSFEEADIQISDGFMYLTSRWVRYRMIIHAHPTVKITYLLVIFAPMTTFLVSVDIIIIILSFVPKILKFSFVNLWDGLKWLLVHIWELIGEVVLAFLRKMLGVLGVFVAGYAIYVFFKSGAYAHVFEFLMKIFQ
ncbi:MAG: hypothetical protein IJ150_10455 [Bacteroidales bacterium]|nr:hypothetical protein [Bacteroidales bacterium]